MEYETPNNWTNFGDVNPKEHGGIFVKWEGSLWHIIETTNERDIGIPSKGHMFEHMWLEPMDIWVNGDPYQGFTERATKGLETFSRLPFEVFNPEDEDELPETYEEYVNWYMENEFGNLIGYLVHHFRGYLHSDMDRSENYWGYLESYGINQEDF